MSVYNTRQKISLRKVQLFGILRQHAGRPQLALEGETVRNILQNLCTDKPELCAASFTADQTGSRPHIRIMLNGRGIIDMLQDFETPVGESDTLAFIPPIAGGFSYPEDGNVSSAVISFNLVPFLHSY